jgi:hypothetical protein
LPKFAKEEKEKTFQHKFKNIVKGRQESTDRYATRKLERFINQYQSSQGLTETQIEQIKELEMENP